MREKKVIIEKTLLNLVPRAGGDTWHLVELRGGSNRILIVIDPDNINIATIATGSKAGSWIGVSSLLNPQAISKQKAKILLEKEIAKVKSGSGELLDVDNTIISKEMEEVYKKNFSKKRI
jgi:hypothetical protein